MILNGKMFHSRAKETRIWKEDPCERTERGKEREREGNVRKTSGECKEVGNG